MVVDRGGIVGEGPSPSAVDRGTGAPGGSSRRLIVWLGVLGFALQAAYAPLAGILLPNQLTAMDAPNKVANLAFTTSVSFAVALVAQPVIGRLSDSTRSRLGRRAPWILGGAVLGAATLALIGHVHTIATLTVCWTVIQVSLNVMLAPMSAVMPDRIPVERRGIASTAAGVGFMLGVAVGTAIGGQLAGDLPLAYTLSGALALVAVVAFVLLNPDPTRADPEARPPSLRQLLASFWVDPRRHPDFAWAFVARFLFVISYFALLTYGLFLMTDYLGIPLDRANKLAGAFGAVTIVGAIVAIVVGGPLSDRLRRRKPFLYAASAIMAVGLAFPLIWPNLAALLVLQALFGLGFGLYQVCDTALMTQVLPDERGSAGKDLGVLNLANAVPQAIAPAVGGVVVLSAGGYPALFVAGIVLVLLGAVVLRPIRSVA